jgi:hypothetical protein
VQPNSAQLLSSNKSTRIAANESSVAPANKSLQLSQGAVYRLFVLHDMLAVTCGKVARELAMMDRWNCCIHHTAALLGNSSVYILIQSEFPVAQMFIAFLEQNSMVKLAIVFQNRLSRMACSSYYISGSTLVGNQGLVGNQDFVHAHRSLLSGAHLGSITLVKPALTSNGRPMDVSLQMRMSIRSSSPRQKLSNCTWEKYTTRASWFEDLDATEVLAFDVVRGCFSSFSSVSKRVVVQCRQHVGRPVEAAQRASAHPCHHCAGSACR